MPAETRVTDILSTEHLKADLKGRSVRGGLVTITSQGGQFLISSVSTLVLARLLTPADFGLVEMVLAITMLAQAFAGMGLSEATIQREELNRDQVSALFWINTTVGLVLALITAALAPFLVWLYHEPPLKDITLVLSLTFFMGGLRVQHDALLKRQMRFNSLAVRDVLSCAVGVSAAVTLAFEGAGYWALVAFPLGSNFTQTTLSWLLTRWVPSLPRRNAQVGSLLGFGGRVAGSYLISNVSRSASNVLIGWWWGAGPLGLFSKAYNLLMLPLHQLNVPVGGVLVPALSRLQNDPERFGRYFLRAANLMMWILAPTFGFLFVAARPVIRLVLGRQWGGAVPVFQLLAVSGLALPLLYLAMWVLVSQGDSKRLLQLLLVITPVKIATCVLSLPLGINGIALLYTLTSLAIMPWALKFTFRNTDLTLQRIGAVLAWPIAVSVGGVSLAEFARRVIAPQNIVAELLVIALGFAVAGALALLLPAVRKEVSCLKGVFGELHWSRQAV